MYTISSVNFPPHVSHNLFSTSGHDLAAGDVLVRLYPNVDGAGTRRGCGPMPYCEAYPTDAFDEADTAVGMVMLIHCKILFMKQVHRKVGSLR